MGHINKLSVILGLLAIGLSGCQSAGPEPLTKISTAVMTKTPAEAEATEEAVDEPSPTTAAETDSRIVLQDSVTLTNGLSSTVRFKGTAQQTIQIEVVLAEGTPPTTVKLIDKFENELAATSSSIDEFTLPYDGSYTIELTPTSGDGNAQLTVMTLEPASGGGSFSEVGTSLAGLFDKSTAYHTYTVTLITGQVVNIVAQANDPHHPDLSMDLYGPDGAFLTSAKRQENATIIQRFVAEQSGMYTIVTGNVEASAGIYTISVNSATIPPAATGDADAPFGEIFQAKFSNRTNVSVTFDGQLGDLIKIQVFDVAEELDVDIYLYSPFDQVIGVATSTGPGRIEAINEFQLPYDGRYRLELRPVGFGEASFAITQLETDQLTGGGLFGNVSSKTLSGVFRQPNVFHAYQFNATAGDIISLVVNSESEEGELDVRFSLIGPTGQELQFSDGTDEDKDPSLLEYAITQNGTYTILIYNQNGGANGSYDIIFSRE